MEHLDVLIVGAGLSGIGMACHLTRALPRTSFAMIESRDAIGGTWDLFRYPGVRSDSDMHTLGYSFRPWRGDKAIADGEAIRQYVVDTAREYGVDAKIRYRLRVTRAAWSSERARWAVELTDADGGTHELTCGFLVTCCGYYRYDEGYTPPLAGRDQFAGTIVHPQHWPADLDHAGKRVVVIGSGATAVTLVPTLAERAAHVTMLQRSPTYIISRPSRDAIADRLHARLPHAAAGALVRGKNIALGMLNFELSRRRPGLVKRLLRRAVARALPPGYDVDTHFTPRYDPWDQRLCLIPDGDLFRAIRRGTAEVVTDTIETFTPGGLRLTSGRELAADIVVTATGLQLLAFGGLALTVDDRAIDLGQTIAYKGMMLCGVPNFVYASGYTNASWTLKVDLVAAYVCRLLAHMAAHHERACTPRAPDPAEPTIPFIDLKSGYVDRGAAQMPRQGSRAPWRLYQNYIRDVLMLRLGSLRDESMQFSR